MHSRHLAAVVAALFPIVPVGVCQTPSTGDAETPPADWNKKSRPNVFPVPPFKKAAKKTVDQEKIPEHKIRRLRPKPINPDDFKELPIQVPKTKRAPRAPARGRGQPVDPADYPELLKKKSSLDRNRELLGPRGKPVNPADYLGGDDGSLPIDPSDYPLLPLKIKPSKTPPRPKPREPAPQEFRPRGQPLRSMEPKSPLFPDVPVDRGPIKKPRDLPLPEDFDTPKQERVRWLRDPRQAQDVAREEGRYHLIAFVGMQWNSRCGLLNDQVFASEPFREFALDNLVLSFLDFPKNLDKAHPYYRKLKKSCKVRGFPSVAIFAPDGERIDTIKGYSKRKGPGRYFEKIKGMIAADAPRVAVFKAEFQSLKNKGFRHWKHRRGKKIFAVLRGTRDGDAFLESREGKRYQVPVGSLSQADRAYLQKRMAERN